MTAGGSVKAAFFLWAAFLVLLFYTLTSIGCNVRLPLEPLPEGDKPCAVETEPDAEEANKTDTKPASQSIRVGQQEKQSNLRKRRQKRAQHHRYRIQIVLFMLEQKHRRCVAIPGQKYRYTDHNGECKINNSVKQRHIK